MKEEILTFAPGKEFYTPEGCFIIENSNSPNDPGVSIAQARIEPGVTTRWHLLKGAVERYLILEGKGLVEIGKLPPKEVNPGDVVIIPPECRQRIRNTGDKDLILSCVVSPGFKQENYVDIDDVHAMTPFGIALVSYFKGQLDASVLIRREDGVLANLPAGHFFREESSFSEIENLALSHCRGHILDIGAGSGIHSLALQKKGLKVTAIDISPELVPLMISRGVKSPAVVDIFNYEGGSFDTLLMLGHGIGICGTLDGLDRFLLHARKLLAPGGRILFDSTDVSKSTDPQNLAYHEANHKAGRYIGEVVFRMEFGPVTGPYLQWFHVDPVTIEEYAFKAGYQCEILLEKPDGEYLAGLKIRN